MKKILIKRKIRNRISIWRKIKILLLLVLVFFAKSWLANISYFLKKLTQKLI